MPYGKDRILSREQIVADKLKAYLQENGVKLDSKYWSNYVNAVAYGGYTYQDAANDIYARQNGKEGNIHPTMDRATFQQERPELFKDVEEKPGDGIGSDGGTDGGTTDGIDGEAGDGVTQIKTSYADWVEANGGDAKKLPRQDSMGRWSWVNEDGSVFEEPGFQLTEGDDGWGYLGEHTADEWTSANSVFNTETLKGLENTFNDLSDLEKQEYIDKAHSELSQDFIIGVAQGQQDTIGALGTALQTYADRMRDEEQALDANVKNTIDAMEASGLTFTGKAREQLGDLHAARSFMSASDRGKVLENIKQLKAIRTGDIEAGEIIAGVKMPEPEGINAEGLTKEETDALWEAHFESPEWKAWSEKVEQYSGQSAGNSLTGQAGQGQYGVQQQLDRFAGARGFEGEIMKKNRQIQESSRDQFASQVKGIVTPFEKLYGSAGLAGMTGPTIGGQSLYGNLSGNVFGQNQGIYQGNLGISVGNQAGNAVDQWSNTINQDQFI